MPTPKLPPKIRRLKPTKRTVTLTDANITQAQAKISTTIQALKNQQIMFRNQSKVMTTHANAMNAFAADLDEKVSSIQKHIEILESVQMDLGLANVSEDDIASYLKKRREGYGFEMIGMDALAQSMGMPVKSPELYPDDGPTDDEYPDIDDDIPF